MSDVNTQIPETVISLHWAPADPRVLVSPLLQSTQVVLLSEVSQKSEVMCLAVGGQTPVALKRRQQFEERVGWVSKY